MRIWNPLTKLKQYLIRRTTDKLLSKLEDSVVEVLKPKGGTMKGWRTIVVNGGIAAIAAFLQFVAGINLPDYGIDGTTATIIMAVVNFVLRVITTTPVGKSND